MTIAYLILAHKDIEQVYLQIDMLNTDEAFFFIHIDKTYKVVIDEKYSKKNNIFFLEHRFHVYWGGYSIVQASLSLINKAHIHNNKFDFFVLLSGQCFPIKSNEKISNYLKNNSDKIFIESKNVEGTKDYEKFTNYYLFDSLKGINTKYKITAFNFLNWSLKTLGHKRKIPNGLVPCFGSQWWALPRHAIEYILEYVANNENIISFMKHTWAPDELFFQNILENSPYKNQITNKPFRYVDWENVDESGSPKTMRMEDFDILINSEHFFARKFDINIDRHILEKIENSFKII